MLIVIVAQDIKKRKETREKFIHSDEVVSLDDSTGSLASLESYAYPSLFFGSAPVVHAKFLFEQTPSYESAFIKTLVQSPTIFICEELTLPAQKKKELEKHGAVLHEHKEEKQKKAPSTIFEITKALTLPSKKDRWLTFTKAIKEHPAEALIGILYWKVRQLIEQAPLQKRKEFQVLYTALVTAHKDAWQKGYPLALALEKVIIGR